MYRLEMEDAEAIAIDEEIQEIQQERLEGESDGGSGDGTFTVTEAQRQETEGTAEWEKKR